MTRQECSFSQPGPKRLNFCSRLEWRQVTAKNGSAAFALPFHEAEPGRFSAVAKVTDFPAHRRPLRRLWGYRQPADCLKTSDGRGLLHSEENPKRAHCFD